MNRIFQLVALLFMVSSSYAQPNFDESKPTALITGANRGIGLEFVNQLSEKGWNVIATTRKPSKSDALNALAEQRKTIVVEQLDVTDHPRIELLAQELQGQPIDLFISNAAITPKYASAYEPLSGVDFEMARKSMDVNAIAPLKLAQAFMPHIEASEQKKLIVLSTKAGSFAESPKMPMMYSYRASKAALNMFMYTLAFETEKSGVILALISPGSVNTVEGMKIPDAIETDESVSKMLKVIESLKNEDNGKFVSYENKSEISW